MYINNNSNIVRNNCTIAEGQRLGRYSVCSSSLLVIVLDLVWYFDILCEVLGGGMLLELRENGDVECGKFYEELVHSRILVQCESGKEVSTESMWMWNSFCSI